ncbi:hypothetical protein GW17_00045569 [Ensete ventricosum]|nr:hypothetical protein GW17_00045569 [Ensete ventricosum]
MEDFDIRQKDESLDLSFSCSCHCPSESECSFIFSTTVTVGTGGYLPYVSCNRPFPRYCSHAVRKENEKLPFPALIIAASAREGARGKSTIALHREDFTLMPREKCPRENTVALHAHPSWSTIINP